MKHIIIICFVMMPIAVNAAAPSTSCPAGFVAVDEPYLTIESTLCPSGTTSVGEAETCLTSSPAGSCMMYAPAATEYTDETGTYEYTEVCPLT